MKEQIKNIRVELLNIASAPNLLAKVWIRSDLGVCKAEAVLCTINKSDNFEKNPDGFWAPTTSMVTKKGGRYPQIKLEGVPVSQITDEFKAALIEMVKEAKTKTAEQQTMVHDWC